MNNDFTICLGRQNQVSYHGEHDEQDFRVTLADTGLESMTGARIKRVQKYIHGDTFMLTYGDGVSDVDICKLVEFHRSHNRLATMTTVRPFSRYGVLELDDRGYVADFREKPQVNGWASAGFFVFNRQIFDYLSSDASCVFEQAPLEKLATDRQLVAYQHEGFFYPMDTYREYLYLNELWRSGEAPWKVS